MRISELADHAGVPVSTIRYYERIGLISEPTRTDSGYRDYDDESATHLLFVTRARRLGVSCDQIAELLPIWGGANCRSAHDRVVDLIDERQAAIAARIQELVELSAQLELVRGTLEASSPPDACRTDLTCCMPDGGSDLSDVAIGLSRPLLPMAARSARRSRPVPVLSHLCSGLGIAPSRP